jgi:hypothetical protein
VPLGFACLFATYHGFDVIRERVSLSDDGHIDEYEKKWDEETEESEDDVAGLSLAFLTVQALRFAIGGTLPDVEGNESPAIAASHDFHHWGALVACAFVSTILVTVAIKGEQKAKEGGHSAHEGGHSAHEGGHSAHKTERVWKILRDYFTFGSAWCSFYGVHWAFAHTALGEQTAMLQVVVALVLSGLAFISIFVMDKVLDNDWLGEGEHAETATECLDEIILALCVLVGFSWEQSFDTAVVVVANSLRGNVPPAFTKLGMSLVLVAVVFPAWRFFILPKELELAEEDSEEGQRLLRLKSAAMQHYSLMVDAETDDHILDRAHLKMKQERWHCHRSHERSSAAPAGLIHLQVTSAGIHAVDHPRAPTGKKKTKHVGKSDTINLLA